MNKAEKMSNTRTNKFGKVSINMVILILFGITLIVSFTIVTRSIFGKETVRIETSETISSEIKKLVEPVQKILNAGSMEEAREELDKIREIEGKEKLLEVYEDVDTTDMKVTSIDWVNKDAGKGVIVFENKNYSLAVIVSDIHAAGVMECMTWKK